MTSSKAEVEVEPSKLKYITVRGSQDDEFPSLSLSPEDSDQVDNQSILNSLVATLVKYGSSGKIEPYLAESWHVSEDGKSWSFVFKKNFTCESGEKITAENFRLSLIENFHRNLSKTDKTEFNLLNGWEDFSSGKTKFPAGVAVENDALIFKFDIAPNGLLNFLRMPYFGFWCKNNFKSGVFRQDGHFSSSGPYKLIKFISNSRCLLGMRKDQPSYSVEAPQFVEIGYGLFSELKNSKVSTIAKIIYENEAPTLENFTAIDGPPVIFQGIVLHPDSDFFSHTQNRAVFSERLSAFKKKYAGYNFSNGFYLTSRQQNMEEQSARKFLRSDKKISFAVQNIPHSLETRKMWEDLFAFIFHDQDYEVLYPKKNDSGWVKGILHNNNYALRTASVYAGAHYVVSVIKMMFCTKLGISFPDPSKRICSLVENYSNENKSADHNFEENFDKIITEDKVVYPLFHARDRWLISDDINLETMPTSIIHPLFEKIRFK